MPRKVAYATEYQPDFGFLWAPLKPREELEKLSREQLEQYATTRQRIEQQSEVNPVAAGWILPSWQEVMANWKNYTNHVILGGNRSSKSSLASRLAVWAACTIPEAEVVAFHVNDDRSVEQQRFVWEAIPQFVKNLPTKKGQNHSITYSQKNGFADGIVIFPPLQGCRRGGSIRFATYKQFQQDAQVAEGFKAHFAWLDEECPQKLFDTLQYRLIDYKGRMMLTFTTLTGWTPLVQDILGKTKTLKKRKAPLLHNQEVPILQESLSRGSTVIHYLWTEDNHFIDTRDFTEQIKSRPKDEIKARAYGIPTKAIGGVFTTFDKEVHVIKHEDLPWIKDPEYKVTHYMAIDPAGKKAWFAVWVAVDADDTWWVWGDDPDIDDWALPGNTVEGKAGPAQRSLREGILDYVGAFLAREKDAACTIYERYIDPRMGAAEKQTLEGATTIISDLDECDFTVIPAPGVDIDNGLMRIKGKLKWDETKPRSSLNAPHFYISDRCFNTIYALQEFTGRGGEHENTKDPIDCLRYLAVSNIEYYENVPDPNNRTGVY
jgi:hypothetical protein